MDVTFPLIQLTGRERALEELTRPDERILRYSGLTIERLQAPYLTIEARIPPTTPAKLRERIIAARNLAIHGYFVYEFHAISMFWAVSCIEMALKMKFAEQRPDPIMVVREAEDGKEEAKLIPVAELQEQRRGRWRVSNMRDFDYSLKALLVWAFRESLLPEDIYIAVPEIMASFENGFLLSIFPARAVKEGLLKPGSLAFDEVLSCWNGLSEAQKRHYRPKASTVLVEELPRFRNMMAHPEHFNFIVFPRAPIGTFELLIEMIVQLWE